MLSPGDAELVRRDRALPGLATLLDPEALVAAVRPYLQEAKVGKVQLTYIRYKPGTNCLANYLLNVQGINFNIYAKAHGHDRSIKLKKAHERKSVRGPLGQGRIILEDQGIVISFFPNDSKLKSLVWLGSAQDRKELLRILFRDRSDLWDGTFHTMHYKPERRYVAQLETTKGPQAVVKFYDPRAYSAALTNGTAFRSQRHLRIPQCLGYLERHGVLAFEWLKGRMLSEILAGDPDIAIHAVQDAGKALAEFHSQEAPGLASRSRKSEAVGLVALADSLGFLCPHLAERAGLLARWLAHRIASEPPVNLSIHGDFYATQAIVTENQVALLDLDEAVRGDPRADLGLFIANLEHDALRGVLHKNHLPALSGAFLESYQRAIGRELPADIQLYIAVGLFHLASHPFRHRWTNWITGTEKFLEMVEATIAKISTNSTRLMGSSASPAKLEKIPVIDPFGAIHDQKIRFLALALDPAEVEPYLVRLIHSQVGENVKVRLRRLRVVRYKRGNRCMVEYDLDVEGHDRQYEVITLLGKVHHRSLDTGTYRLYEAFWNGGFDAKSPDGISIPQPTGMVPELQMWFQRKVQGTAATHILVKSNGVELARRIAEAIHKVHLAKIPCDRKHTMVDELRILHERLARAAEENPAWRGRIEQVLNACNRLATYVPEPETVGIHRDFYPDQVIVDGTRLYLTDFDLYCEGDPSLDIGNFLGHLQEQALRTMGDIHALADREEAFVKRFLELSGESRRLSVQIHTTLTLVRHIWISTQFPDRHSFTESLLSLCERRLEAQLRQYRL